ncbi:MAG TPA: 16S rRNA (adenine(1518)-N(6)/adenine(1519)-N(6))-dimethyltransferase RsmA [Fulvivirga sp.]|nr:16S rRNA (adenine(1518)-N(6)/adenine(1519)-N(6))-dimethyltransferase RsmA [Fulvivirga sp.]
MVKAKKHLGQHFLTDESIALDIVKALNEANPKETILEIGPGTGVLTKYLVEEYNDRLMLIDLDRESVDYLHQHYPDLQDRTLYGDFIRKDIDYIPTDHFSIIGNFPYNISSQIFFKVLEVKDRVDNVICMLQYEVAKRLVSPPGNKDYGILSVLLQAYYKMEYLFDVEPHVFHPPPKVRSGVIRLIRNETITLDCDEKLFKRVIKQGFQNRRKTLRNALKPLNLPPEVVELEILNRRAETLSVDDFVLLSKQIENWNQ